MFAATSLQYNLTTRWTKRLPQEEQEHQRPRRTEAVVGVVGGERRQEILAERGQEPAQEICLCANLLQTQYLLNLLQTRHLLPKGHVAVPLALIAQGVGPETNGEALQN